MTRSVFLNFYLLLFTFYLSKALRALLLIKILPAEGCEDAADQRSGDEDPDTFQRVAAHEERGAEGAGRVHGRAGEENAEQVDTLVKMGVSIIQGFY